MEVRAAGTLVTSVDNEIEVLAYDQWGGTNGIPDLLAAFSLPNNPVIDRVLHEAAELLAKGGKSAAIKGYQSKNREDVWSQISAIYSALARKSLRYSVPPASFASDGQKIRTPDRILEGGVGTCLDLTMLMAGCLEQAGLNPVVLLKEGHSWIGCWLLNTSFPSTIIEDAQAVRKRIDAGELIAFEMTGLGQRPVISLRLACEIGSRYLHEDQAAFQFALDIRRARIERVHPLPSRHAATLTEREIADIPEIIEPIPSLPSLAGEAVLLDEDAKVDSPEGRLNRWKSKLLDLTRRNRLLNFKATRVMVPLRVPDTAKLEDELSDGKEWKFRAQVKIMEGDDPRSAGVEFVRTGENPVEAMAQAAMRNHELLPMVDKTKLDSQLYEIYLTVKTNLEEGGANTLFLAIGFLRWTEDERSEKENLAPILLVPVTLNRASVRTGFSIVRHDDETIVNPTLLQMLRDNYGVDVKGLDPLPTDESGVDVEKIFATFRQAVKEVPRWEVNTDVYLGVFSFTKFLMWKDLKDRTADLKKNRVVGHLIDRNQEPLPSESSNGVAENLDERHAPGSLLAPMLADSSQLNALSKAGDGHDFVLEGPPGTGKSQTITNLIAHFLGIGKRVLFVSEKMAALGVVERRLNAVGLGPFCLQLHSQKARKTEVLERLRKSLYIGSAATSSDWEIEIDRIAKLRADLNGLVNALHRVHPNGLTVRSALDCVISKKGWPVIAMQLPNLDALDQRGLAALRELGSSIQAVLAELDELPGHKLTAIQHEEWSHGWEEKMIESCVTARSAAMQMTKSLTALAPIMGRSLETASFKTLHDLDNFFDVLLSAPEVPAPLISKVGDSGIRKSLRDASSHGVLRNQAWQRLGGQFRESIANLQGTDLQNRWSKAASEWWLPRLVNQRGISGELMIHSNSGIRPLADAVPAILTIIQEINDHDRAISNRENDLRSGIGDLFVAVKTDWDAVQRHEAWAERADQAIKLLGPASDEHDWSRNCFERLAASPDSLRVGGVVAERVVEFRKALLDFDRACEELRSLSANASLFEKNDRTAGVLARVQVTCSGWESNRPSMKLWCKWRSLRALAAKSGLGKVIIQMETSGINGKPPADFIDYAYQLWWLKGIIDREAILRTFSSADHERKIREFRFADEKFQKLTEKYIFAKLASKVPTVDAKKKNAEMAVLTRELAKQRAHYPVRKLIQHIPNVLPQLKPCMLMSPISVAQYLDAGHAMFDVVIFDEASQIPVWDAVGAIARGKQVIVVGDPKQLPPTNFFEKRDESDDEGEVTAEDAPVKDLESILDECMGAGMARLSLDWHYRSKHESLIAFSNARYYASRLITFPSPVTTDVAVRFIPVSGIYDRGASRTNRAEADSIVDRICSYFGQEDPKKRESTMGVVTFNISQMRLIDTLLQERLLARPELEERIAAHGDERLFIKNLENVQGDERDIILFSITFGKDSAGKMPMNFGPINQDGGHRRLNVAVTRARSGVEIYSSIRPDDIDLARTRAQGVADLKAYLDYAIRGARAIAEESMPTGGEPDSPFEQAVLAALRDAGWEAHPQVGCSGYRIDIGIVDKNRPGRYLAGIECDGATYHSLKTARDRDRLRQGVLENLGWKIIRVWSTDWWADPKKVTGNLLKQLAEVPPAIDN